MNMAVPEPEFNKRLLLASPSDPILTQVMPHYHGDHGALRPFVFDMWALMIQRGGIGLAAPQVGATGRFFIMRDPETSSRAFREGRVCVNPYILDHAAELSTAFEGCLTFPGKNAPFRRRPWVHAYYTDLRGKLIDVRLEGIQARVFQHELDHLNGRVIFAAHR